MLISTVHLSKKKRRTQQSKKIGLAGEEHVYEYEYNKLKNLKKKDLADKIKKHFEVYEYPGWDITSFDKNGNKDFTKHDWNGNNVLLFGSESYGLKYQTLKNSDYLLKINISKKVESLNISNSASIVFHYINNLRKELN